MSSFLPPMRASAGRTASSSLLLDSTVEEPKVLPVEAAVTTAAAAALDPALTQGGMVPWGLT